MPVELLRWKFTVEQYHQMAQAGILIEDDRVELIGGEFVEMSPIGRRHAACVNRLNALFNQRLVQAAIVGVQNPVELDDNFEPQPDLALLRRRADFYEAGHPRPEDILLLVEVADTTVEFDREVKNSLYAQDGVSEVWLVHINAQCFDIYRQPSPNGYQDIQKYQRGQSVFVQVFPDVSFTVDEVLG